MVWDALELAKVMFDESKALILTIPFSESGATFGCDLNNFCDIYTLPWRIEFTVNLMKFQGQSLGEPGREFPWITF